MAITAQPATPGANNNYYAAYGRLLYYQFTESVDLTTGGEIKNAVITVKSTTGAVINTDIVVRVAPTSTSTIGNIQTGVFNFDSSGIIQTIFCKREKPSIFPAILGRDTAVNNDDVTGGTNLEVTYEREDNNGLLVSTGTLDTTNFINIINGTVQQRESPVRQEYFVDNPGRLFLTKRPRCAQVCLTESDYLHFYKDDPMNAIQVNALGSGGPQTGIIDITATPSNNQLATIGTGPANINNFAFLSGGVTIDSTVTSYEVIVGDWDGFGFTAVTETMSYVMTPCCRERDCRLFWLNRLGGVDAYTFRGENTSENNPKSRQYEKPLSIPRVVPDYGIGKYDSRDNAIGTYRTRNLSRADSLWLQELYTSPQVCKGLIDSNNLPLLFPVVVQDTQNTILDSETGILQHEIQIIEAVPRIIQQYY